MDSEERDRRTGETPAGESGGPDAPRAAAARALAAATSARSVVLVEGISDQIALDTLAVRHGRDLASERVVIVPIGGAHAIERYLVRFGPLGDDCAISGMCDAGEELFVRQSLAASGMGSTGTRAAMERLGFFVCVEDLEDELIRASGRESIEAVLDDQGDLKSFRTLQKQPAWKQQTFDAQMHRFLGAGARRKSRYARLLVDSLPLERVPRPLQAVLERT